MPPKATDDARRKSGSKPSLFITLKVDPKKLGEVVAGDSSPASQDSAEEVKKSPSSVDAKTTPAPNAVDQASDSNAATPQPEGTPAPGVMAPPADGPKKKGTKRSAANANGDGTPKAKGKPGPKKKPRLEDGTIDHAAKPAAHKLGPKANQGAINAGLRALDRSGKPCRKWNRGGFTLKSFTGTIWEIPRWTAPPKKTPESSTGDSTTAASADNSSSKENKETAADNSALNSNNGADAEMPTPAASNHASSPAPMALTAAS